MYIYVMMRIRGAQRHTWTSNLLTDKVNVTAFLGLCWPNRRHKFVIRHATAYTVNQILPASPASARRPRLWRASGPVIDNTRLQLQQGPTAISHGRSHIKRIIGDLKAALAAKAVVVWRSKRVDLWRLSSPWAQLACET